MSLFTSEAQRLERFPVARKQIFLGHAGVTVLPHCVAEAMIAHVRASSEDHQEFGEVLRDIEKNPPGLRDSHRPADKSKSPSSAPPRSVRASSPTASPESRR